MPLSVVRAPERHGLVLRYAQDINRYSGFTASLPTQWAGLSRPTMELLYQLSYLGVSFLRKDSQRLAHLFKFFNLVTYEVS